MAAACRMLLAAVVVEAIREDSSVSGFQQVAAGLPRIYDTATVSNGNGVSSNPDPQADHEDNPRCISEAIYSSRYSDILVTKIKTVAQVVAAVAAPDMSEALRKESFQDAAVGEETHLHSHDAVGQEVDGTKVGEGDGESSNGDSDRRSDNRQQAAAKSWASQSTVDADSAEANIVSNTIIRSTDTSHRTDPTSSSKNETTFAGESEGAIHAAMQSSSDEELSCPALLVSPSCASWGAQKLRSQK